MARSRSDPPSLLDRPGAPPAARWIPAGVLVLLLLLFPLVVTKPYPLHMGVILFLAVLMGSAWNVIGGYAGQYSVGHAAYFGAGAYTAVLLLERFHLAPWWGLPAAMVCAVAVALVVGSITFRLRGPYFVLASIAVAEIIRLAALHFRGLTHGAEGFVVAETATLHLPGVQISFAGKRPFYFLTLLLAILAVAVSRTVLHSRLGYRLLAIREDQDAAQSLGIHLARTKNAALAISAALTGMAGAVFVGYSRFIDPAAAFGIDVSIQMVLICILGGIGTVEGPIIGAVLLVPISEVLRNPRGLETVGVLPPGSALVGFIERYLSHAHQLVYGVLIVVLILFAPEGVAGLLRRWAARRRRTDSPPAAVPSP
jgi:branched-chain amino acid transport system permease protein